MTRRPTITFELWELRMRFSFLIAGLAFIPQAALAQPSVCQSIANQMDRLACYNTGSPPPPAAVPPKKADIVPKRVERPVAPKTKSEPDQFVDVLADENKKLGAKLKTICRGC
jgi:hypothetical protein